MTDDSLRQALHDQRCLIANCEDRGLASLARAYLDAWSPPAPDDPTARLSDRLYFHTALPEALHRLDPRKSVFDNRPRDRAGNLPALGAHGGWLAVTLQDLPVGDLRATLQLYRPAPARDGVDHFEIIARDLLPPELERRLAPDPTARSAS